MVCPPYTFVVGNFQGELFIIDTHVIRSQLVGNGNGIVITFSKIEHFTQWLLRRLESSGVKMDDMYDIYIYQVSFVKSRLTSYADEDESCNRTTRK